MKHPEWVAPAPVAKGVEHRQVFHRHAVPERHLVVGATIDTPEHIPALIPGRSCEHDGPKHAPDEHGKLVKIEPHGHCLRCNLDEETQTYRDAIEVAVLNVRSGELIARTSLISKSPNEETVLHVEPGCILEPEDKVEVHFRPRGAGHDIPMGFKLKLQTIPLAD